VTEAGLWVAFGFGIALGAFLGHAFGRRSRAAMTAPPPPPRPSGPTPAGPVTMPAGAPDVLNALNNRLAAVNALTELLHAAGLEEAHRRVLTTMQSELRQAADLTAHFAELAVHPGTPTEAAALAPVLETVLAERDATLRSLAVAVRRSLPAALPMVACSKPLLHEVLGKLVDFSLHRLRAAHPPRELHLAVAETGPSLVLTLSDSGAPLSVTAEEQLLTPFRFTQGGGGGGEIEFALARALVHGVAGTMRLRPRAPGAEIVVTLPRSVLGPPAHPAGASGEPAGGSSPLRILVVDDDTAHRNAVTLLLRTGGHQVAAVGDGMAALSQLREQQERYDVVLADLQMPHLGGRALFEQLSENQPTLAKRFVFMTGDRARPETQAFLDQCGQPSVMKPYDLGELLAAIRTAAKR
jgi:CheY-like chemotaxis protein